MTAADYVRFLDRTSTRPGERHRAVDLLALGAGQRCLDVGCGVGEDARAMAAAGARVVGVDLSPAMAVEARSRSRERQDLSFVVADAERLPFPDSTFDAAWMKRTLMHISSPGRVIGELARVVRPGGRVVAVEPDLEHVLLDSGVAGVTRTVLSRHAASYANPWAGRQLRRLLLEAGLVDVGVAAEPARILGLDSADAALRLFSTARSAVDAGLLTHDEASRWEADLRSRDEQGLFGCWALVFTASGRVPEGKRDRPFPVQL